MATLYLLTGPVGAGKTTHAQQLVARHGALFLDLDVWMVRLYGDDPRPDTDRMGWYLARRERVRGVLWDLTVDALAAGVDVVLESGLLGEAERRACYDRAADADLDLVVHVIDAPRDVRRARVEARNARGGPWVQPVPPAFFEAASDAWEPPSDAERALVSVVDLAVGSER